MFRKQLFHFIVAIALAGCTNSSSPPAEENLIQIPESAYDIRKYSLEQDSAYQVNFKINAVYPNIDVYNFYNEYLAAKGWHACTNNLNWDEFEKGINGKLVRIRQNLQSLASKEEQKLLTIVMQHINDNDQVQNVTVILYDIENNNDFKKVLSLLSLKCGSALISQD